MKSLDSLLESLHLRSAVQNRVVLGEPWGVAFPAEARAATFHFFEEGDGGVLAVPGESPVRLAKGDLAIVFADGGHSVADVAGTRPTDLHRLLREADVICASGITLRFGGDGPETSVISGYFHFEESAAAAHPLWRMLPPFIVLRGRDGQAAEWLDTTLSLLSREAMAVRPGVSAVLDRLCDVLFIQALRGWVRADGAADGFAAAVRDPAIDAALDLLQRAPAEPWTLETLAGRVALSRSTFAERFRRLTGDTPMEYLARWRMHRAAQLLGGGGPESSVAAVAREVGYESEAAFAKAFKRRVGVAPGAYRRSRAAGVRVRS